MSVGAKIRFLREKNGLTQEDLAAAINTTKQTIYKYETGIITNIPLDKLETLSKLLNVSAAYLAGWDEETQNKLQNNDFISDVIIKLRRNEKFVDAVKALYALPDEKIEKVTQILALL